MNAFARRMALLRRATHPNTPAEEARTAAMAYCKMERDSPILDYVLKLEEENARLKAECEGSSDVVTRYAERVLRYLDATPLSHRDLLHCFQSRERKLAADVIKAMERNGTIERFHHDGGWWWLRTTSSAS